MLDFLRRAADVLGDLDRNGPPAPDRGAEVAAERVAHEPAVLAEDGLVAVELGTHLRDLVGRSDELGVPWCSSLAGRPLPSAV